MKKTRLSKEARKEKYTLLARDRSARNVENRRNAGLVCFRCRKKGHVSSQCTEANLGEKTENGGICYHCGSSEHRLGDCNKYKRKRQHGNDVPLPYATCFLCSGSGHLASACPSNTGRGIYVNGGACRGCGGVDHLFKDCPMSTQKTKTRGKKTDGFTEVEEVCAEVDNGMRGGDELIEDRITTEMEESERQKLKISKKGVREVCF
eukprot:CAMPEP_0113320726 /NCGR_PEP_ID=MMETSP0010_2-20120614/14447_1 /TAXON_ID=216773 ORGANISM="Corethron hystrix, Strain 308" /NCGR_SAMPLE_ID=MMETSP0010_2 /ASSEMBLY_ACC=CAM_ASM_000155 /LENGTH=205 /DNA_ID=CAMNT_0000178621 /DNA_START=117 /DNA_END=734 /DNA_ORIENTATION=- /assembly_acc=CAM_ASM_000155